MYMPPSREERKEAITKQRKQQILDAALAVFSRKGFAEATTAEIAQAAGIAEGTIYNYFKSKRELFITVIRESIITTPLLDLIEKIPKANIDITFRQILQNRFNLIESAPISGIPSLMGEIIRDPELKALWAEQFLQPFFARVEEIFRAMMTSGKFRPLDPAIATRIIGSLMLGFLMLNIMEGESSPLNRLPQEEVANALVDFVGRGLMNDNGDKKSRRAAYERRRHCRQKPGLQLRPSAGD
jgi:AcrR family transcriptional regulator